MRVKVEASAIEALPLNQRLSNWDISDYDVSLNGRACAAFLAYVALELALPNKAVMSSDVSHSIAFWRSIAEQCQFARRFPGRPRIDNDLTKALSAVEEYFNNEARLTNERKATSLYVLSRSIGKRDMERVCVRAIAEGFRAIFGSIKYGFVTRVANVALKTEAEIDIETVRDWCAKICQ